MIDLIKSIGSVVIFIAITIVLYCVSLTIANHLNVYLLGFTVMMTILFFVFIVFLAWHGLL
jgi:hypothetical protein